MPASSLISSWDLLAKVQSFLQNLQKPIHVSPLDEKLHVAFNRPRSLNTFTSDVKTPPIQSVSYASSLWY